MNRELRDLEDRLARRPAPGPAAGFRERLLSAADATVADAPPRRRHWIARAAAAAVVILNFALCVDNGIRFRQLEAPPADAPQTARSDALESDDRLEALAASAASSLRPAPDAGTLGRDFFKRGEVRRWATP